jgi:hypothetical protein
VGQAFGGFLDLCEKVFFLIAMPREGNYVRVRQGFGGFLGLCEKVFSLTTMPGGGLPLQVEFFFQNSTRMFTFLMQIYEFWDA